MNSKELKTHLIRFLTLTEVFFLVLIVVALFPLEENTSVMISFETLSGVTSLAVALISLLMSWMAHMYRKWVKEAQVVVALEK